MGRPGGAQAAACKLIEQFHQRDFGAVQLPVAGEDAAVLVAVAVAEHDVLLAILQICRALHHPGDAWQAIELAHDGRRVAQVLNRLEQRHDDQVSSGFVVQRALHQTGFLLQQQHFEQVAHGPGVADDVVPDRLRAVLLPHAPGGLEDREFALRMDAIRRTHHAQRTGVGQQLEQQLPARWFFEFAVARFDAGCGQQFGNDFLMRVRALPQVQRGQVEAEHFHGANQRVQSLRHQSRAMIGEQRILDRVQVGQEILMPPVRVLRRHRMARRIAAGELLERGGQARVDAGQGAAVGLIHAVLVGVGRAVGQRPHWRRHIHQHGRERKLSAQVVHLGEVMAQRHFALPAQRVLERLRADVGVAVTVAADPVAHAQKTVDRMLTQLALQLRIELGNLAQEGRLVIAQCVFDFVGHRQFGEAQQARLPQLHHARTDLGLVGCEFARRQRVLGQGPRLDFVALCHQPGDVALGVQDAFALHFGGVGGEHRRHITARQRLRHCLGADAGPAQARQRHLDAAFLGVAGPFMDGAAPDVVAVLGQVGQVAEIGEGADDAHRLSARKRLEQAFQRLVCFVVRIAPERHRQLADALDQFVGLEAFLLADHVAQNAAQQADVIHQRTFVVLGAPRGRFQEG